MEEWLEVSVKVTHEAVEAVAELLRETGARNGVLIEDPVLLEELREHTEWELCPPKPSDEDLQVVTVSAFYPEDEELQPRLARIDRGLALIEERIGAFRFGPVLFRKVSEKDWANEWKQYFHVTHVGKHIVIKPSWEQYDAQAGDVVLELDPGMAFGTGTHETTFMCMEQLERYVKPGCRAIDVGCGSGILALAAAKLGARDVLAIDLDELAVKVAAENTVKNGLSDVVRVKHGDLLENSEEQADVIVANIIADVICFLCGPAKKHLLPGGVFICSGIIREREDDVQRALAQAGYTVCNRLAKGEWVCLAATL